MKDIPFVDIQQNGRSLNFFSLPSSVPILAHYLQDFGLVARLGQGDMDAIVSAVIHCANRDYASLVDDFILLGILPNDCDPAEIRDLIKVGQETFLTQLLQVGVFHSDPHPGNLLRLDDDAAARVGARLCLLVSE